MSGRLRTVGCWLWDNPHVVALGAFYLDLLVVRAVEGLGAPSLKRAMVGDVLAVAVVVLHLGRLARYLAHAHPDGPGRRRLVRAGCWVWKMSRRVAFGAVLLILLLVEGTDGWDRGRTERVVFGVFGLIGLLACVFAYWAARSRQANERRAGVTGLRVVRVSVLGWIGERTCRLDSWVDRARRRAIRRLSDSDLDRLTSTRRPATSPAASSGGDNAGG